jgi:hypothetical protein
MLKFAFGIILKALGKSNLLIKFNSSVNDRFFFNLSYKLQFPQKHCFAADIHAIPFALCTFPMGKTQSKFDAHKLPLGSHTDKIAFPLQQKQALKWPHNYCYLK